MTTEIIGYALIGIFLGPVASFAITPIFCLLRTIFFVPFIFLKQKTPSDVQSGGVVQPGKVAPKGNS